MRLHRFIVDLALKPGLVELRDEELVNQLRNVLRLRAGDSLVLCDGDCREAVTKLVAYRGDRVELQIEDIQENQNEPAMFVTLYCALLRKENFELVVQKVTEIGVSRIVPVITKRTVKLQTREDRLLKIAKEAAEQSGRGRVPEIAAPMDFEKACAESKKEYERTFFFSLAEAQLESKTLSIETGQKIALFIGPEGGWDPEEVDLARASGFQLTGLGPLTLRGETAAIVAAYLLIASCRRKSI